LKLSVLNAPKRFLELTALFQKFFEMMINLHPDYRPIIARQIVGQMFESLETGLLTYAFLQYFQYLNLDFNPTDPHDSMFSPILNVMFQVAVDRIFLLVSGSTHDSNRLYSWLLFTIRYGTARTNDHSNSILAIFLKSYQDLFTNAVFFNTKRISNQSAAIRTIGLCLRAVKKHCSSHRQSPKLKNKLKAFQFDDFHDQAKLDAMRTIMKVYLEESRLLSLSQLIPVLDFAFRTGNPESIAVAAGICLEKLTPEKIRKYSASSDIIHRLFSSYFNAMADTPLNTSIEILKRVPGCAPLFLKSELPRFSRRSHWRWRNWASTCISS
jgi:hypothetical protein